MARSLAHVTGPLFKWFGSKWLASKLYPAPVHSTIIEPFAGSAGYSLRHAQGRSVALYETDKHLLALWKWLISEATQASILEIPLGVREGTDIRSLGLSQGQALLFKTWQRTNNVGNCWTISPWGNKPGQWTANTRSRVAEEFEVVRGWSIHANGYSSFDKPKQSTWFIDPPYQFNYKYKSAELDYLRLGKAIISLPGQVIVCEAVCQKTSQAPTWLPFTLFGSRITSRRKLSQNHHSKELLWSKQG